MPSVNENIADAEIRHSVYMLGYSTRIYNQQTKLLDAMVADLIMQLNKRVPADNSFTASRLKAMLEVATEQSNQLYKAIQASVNDELKQLSEYEAAFHVRAIEGAYPIQMALVAIPAQSVYSATMARPFQGKLLREWWKDQDYSTRRSFQAALKLGYVEGETINQIATRLRGVGNTSKEQTRSIVRTAVAHMSQVALNQTTQANSDILVGEEWVSTLDGRTSPICRARDGKIYKIGVGAYPPAHINCRSRRVPRVKSWKEMGFTSLNENDSLDSRRYVADKRRVKDIPKSDRDKLTGITKAKTYNEWLKTQPRGFVEDVLGKKKAKLYLDGNLPLTRFVNPQGVEYTLEQLAKREKKVYERVL